MEQLALSVLLIPLWGVLGGIIRGKQGEGEIGTLELQGRKGEKKANGIRGSKVNVFQ